MSSIEYLLIDNYGSSDPEAFCNNDLYYYEAIGLNTNYTENLFVHDQLSMNHLHKVINLLVREVSKNIIWFKNRRHVLEEFCTEFEENTPNLNQLNDRNSENRKSTIKEDETIPPHILKQHSKDSSELAYTTSKERVRDSAHMLTDSQGLQLDNQVTQVASKANLTESNSHTHESFIQRKKNENKSKLTSQVAEEVTAVVKNDVYNDIKEIIHNTIVNHASLITISQVTNKPISDQEQQRDELKEVMDRIGALSEKNSKNEQLIHIIDKRTDDLGKESKGYKEAIGLKAQRDELANVQFQLQSYAMKADLENMEERLSSYATAAELNKVNIMVSEVKTGMTQYTLVSTMNDKLHLIDEALKVLKDEKIDKTVFDSKLNEVHKNMELKDGLIDQLKVEIKNSNEEYKKSIKRVYDTLELKADREKFFEVLDQVKNFVDRKELHKVEEKVFPMMKEIIKKTSKFSEKIEDSISSMQKYDEAILECAKNVDIRDLKNKINSCLKTAVFEEFKIFQTQVNFEYETQIKDISELGKGNGILIDMNTEKIEKNLIEIENIKIKQQTVITHDDMNEIKERMNIKADKLDLAQVYDLKANKQDIAAVNTSIDSLHLLVEQIAHLGLSTIKTLVMEVKDTDDYLNKNRGLLLKHANVITSRISKWTVGDPHMNNTREISNSPINRSPMMNRQKDRDRDTQLKDRLNKDIMNREEGENFNDFVDSNLKEVRGLLSGAKSSKVILGNKGFSNNKKAMSNQRIMPNKFRTLTQTPDLKETNMTLPSIY